MDVAATNPDPMHTICVTGLLVGLCLLRLVVDFLLEELFSLVQSLHMFVELESSSETNLSVRDREHNF